MHFNEVKGNFTELTTIGTTAANFCCQWFHYIYACVRFLMLWVVELIFWLEEGAFCVECSAVFLLPPTPPTFYCLLVRWVPVFVGAWELMGGLSGFASHWCSFHLGAGYQRGRSSRKSQARNLHLALQLTINIDKKKIVCAYI